MPPVLPMRKLDPRWMYKLSKKWFDINTLKCIYLVTIRLWMELSASNVLAKLRLGVMKILALIH